MNEDERRPAWIKVVWGIMALGTVGLLGLGLLVVRAVSPGCIIGRVHDHYASLNNRERADYLAGNQPLFEAFSMPNDLRIVQVSNFANTPEDGGVVEGMTTNVELRLTSSADQATALMKLVDALKAAGWSVGMPNDGLFATRGLATLRTWPGSGAVLTWSPHRNAEDDWNTFSFGMPIDHAARAAKPVTRGCYPDW